MLCQNCGKRPANIHLTKVINDERMDLHLCEQCAKENSQITYDYPFGINNFLAGLLDMPISYPVGQSHKEEYKCKACGLTLEEFKRNGKLGCAECYEVFSQNLLPILKRLHGNTHHSGKLPQRTGGAIKVKKEMERLRNQLSKAIKDEAYEKAAELRDKIKELEQSSNIRG